MISSGTKRGLAAVAVSALAVAGLPFLASSASADPGDTLSVLSQGPIRNGNDAGGVVTLKSNSATIDPNDIFVTDASYGNPVAFDPAPGAKEITSAAFDVDVISFTLLDGVAGAPAGDKFPDGTYHYAVQTAVTLGTATKATFGLVEDADGSTPVVSASDPKTTVDVTPTGAPASVDISTTQPSTVANAPVTYNVEVKDAAGNLTQLIAGEEFDVTGTAGAGVAPGTTLDDSDFTTGKTTYTAAPTAGGSQTVTVTGSTPPAASITDSQTITVYNNATITAPEFGLTTGADTWKDGVTTFGAPSPKAQIRVDQNSVTFNFQGKDDLLPAPDGVPDDAGKAVVLQLTSSTIKIDGKDASVTPVTVFTLLDGTGKGSITVPLSNVTEGATFTFGGPFSGITNTTIEMARPKATNVIADKSVYVTKIGSATPVTVSVKDQFGNAIGSPAQVSITRSGRAGNAGTTARTTVDASGVATFSLPDAGTTAGSEQLDLNVFDDQFDAVASTTVNAATINYTADGFGGDFTVVGATSDPAANVINPLWDSNTGGGTFGDDSLPITLAGGTSAAPATVTVDNGALILTAGETNLSQGSASETLTLTGGVPGGAGGFTVVGTKTGVVTVTIDSGGRTKTVKLTVAQQAPADAIASARNVAIEAPDSAKAGDVAVFKTTVTDAFGNPVAGFDASDLGFQVSGPANSQGTSEAVTDANGVVHENVILSDNASSPVTVRVTGFGSQFGSAADKIGATAAPGLTASVQTATDSITDVKNIAELQKAVDDAQAAVDIAQNNLDNAKGDLSVAKTEQSVAKKAVKQAKKALKKAKKHHKGVNAAKKDLNDAKGAKQIADSKVKQAQKKVDNAKETLAAAKQKLADAQQALEDAQNEG